MVAGSSGAKGRPQARGTTWLTLGDGIRRSEQTGDVQMRTARILTRLWPPPLASRQVRRREKRVTAVGWERGVGPAHPGGEERRGNKQRPPSSGC